MINSKCTNIQFTPDTFVFSDCRRRNTRSRDPEDVSIYRYVSLSSLEGINWLAIYNLHLIAFNAGLSIKLSLSLLHLAPQSSLVLLINESSPKLFSPWSINITLRIELYVIWLHWNKCCVYKPVQFVMWSEYKLGLLSKNMGSQLILPYESKFILCYLIRCHK